MKITESKFKELFFSMSAQALAKKLKCHWQTINRRARKLGLRKQKKGEKLVIIPDTSKKPKKS